MPHGATVHWASEGHKSYPWSDFGPLSDLGPHGIEAMELPSSVYCLIVADVLWLSVLLIPVNLGIHVRWKLKRDAGTSLEKSPFRDAKRGKWSLRFLAGHWVSTASLGIPGKFRLGSCLLSVPVPSVISFPGVFLLLSPLFSQVLYCWDLLCPSNRGYSHTSSYCTSFHCAAQATVGAWSSLPVGWASGERESWSVGRGNNLLSEMPF